MTLAEFQARYPQYAANSLAQTYLTESLLYIGAAYEEYANKARGLYAAHCCAVEAEAKARALASPGTAFGRDVVHKGAGKLSISRDASLLQKQATDPWMATVHGQELCWLRDNVAGKGALVTGGDRFEDGDTGVCGIDPLLMPTGEPE